MKYRETIKETNHEHKINTLIQKYAEHFKYPYYVKHVSQIIHNVLLARLI